MFTGLGLGFGADRRGGNPRAKRRSLVPAFLPRRPRFERLEDRRLLAAFTVTTLQDQNNGATGGTSLREAIAQANASPEHDDIYFVSFITGPNAVARLTLGELVISSPLSIQGPGANLLKIDASGNDPTPLTNNGDGSRVFRVERSNSLAPVAVTISGVAITGGDVGSSSSQGGSGGGIWSNQNLTLTDVVVTSNASTYRGGGIFQVANQTGFTSKLILQSSTISYNSGGQFAGGILIHGAGEIVDSKVQGNTSSVDGGGLFFTSTFTAESYLTIENSQVIGNSVPAVPGGQRRGGGVFNNQGRLTIIASTISGNTTANGGGIYSVRGELTISTSTVSNNTASSGIKTGIGGGIHATSVTSIDTTVSGNIGGGIWANSAKIVNSTISGNSFPYGTLFPPEGEGRGSAIYSSELLLLNSTVNGASGYSGSVAQWKGSSKSFTIVNSIVTHLDKFPDFIWKEPDAPLTLLYSLIGLAPSSGPNVTMIGVIFEANPKLGPLDDNGGPTQTHALLPGSVAINAGNPAFNPADPDGNPTTNDALFYDQRGAPFPRVTAGRIDMGAFESQPVPDSADFDSSGRVDGRDFLIWQRGFGKTPAGKSTGDADNDRQVDGDDLTVWKSQFGQSAPASQASLSSSVTAGEQDDFAISARLVDAAIAWDFLSDPDQEEELVVVAVESLNEAYAISAISPEPLPAAPAPSEEVFQEVDAAPEAADDEKLADDLLEMAFRS